MVSASGHRIPAIVCVNRNSQGNDAVASIGSEGLQLSLVPHIFAIETNATEVTSGTQTPYIPVRQIPLDETPILPILSARILAGAEAISIPSTTPNGASNPCSLIRYGFLAPSPGNCAPKEATARQTPKARQDAISGRCRWMPCHASTMDNITQTNVMDTAIIFHIDGAGWCQQSLSRQSTDMLPLSWAICPSDVAAPRQSHAPTGQSTTRQIRLSDISDGAPAQVAGTT